MHGRNSALRSWATLVGATIVYAGIAIAWTWPLATVATTDTVLPYAVREGLALNDQAYSISAAARNAAAIAEGDVARLIDWRLCHPTPHAGALGEHGIELGLLALPAWVATHNPILAYNVGCLLLILIAGASTFALVRSWTGSAAAGLVAGLAFAFHPKQVDDLMHPFVMGIHWIPIQLLAIDRLLETGRTGWAVTLAVASGLQVCVGAYPMMAMATFVGVYGVLRVMQYRAVLDSKRLARLLVAGGAIAMVAGVVLWPYATSGSWGAERRQLVLVPFAMLLPGGRLALGATTLAFAALALVWRGSRRSPTMPVLVAGAACVLISGGGRLWPGGPAFHGLYPWLADRLWILGIVRVPAAIRTGAYLAIALLAGIGLGRLLDRISARALPRLVVAAAAFTLVLVEYFNPTVSQAVYFSSRRLALVDRRPSDEALAAYAVFDRDGLDGPIVEIPFDEDGTAIVSRMPTYSLLAAYHGRETAACFTSHVPPSYHEVNRMVGEMATAPGRAVTELAAAGFRNVVFHHGRFRRPADAFGRIPGVRTLLRSGGVSAFRITRPVSPHADAGQLGLDRVSTGRFAFKGYRSTVVELTIHNTAARAWALPHPVAPLAVRWRWVRADGTAVGPWANGVSMLPLALAGGATATIRAKVQPAPRGCDCVPEVEVPALGWHATGTVFPG